MCDTHLLTITYPSTLIYSSFYPLSHILTPTQPILSPTALEDKTTLDSLGLDAKNCGNELRFINSYLNVDFGPNVTMRTVYINTYPHICIVCMRDIEIGDEFLLDYGEAYNKAYLTPPVKVPNIPVSVV